MKIIIATHNRKKLTELKRILAPLGIEAVIDANVGITLPDVEETGSTFEENAFLKADSGCKVSGLACIADDSGLCVDALGGAPGVYSARYSGIHGDDESNIDKLLTELTDVPDEERTARFVCAVCCVFPNGRKITVRGECEGVILRERHGNSGFGYDPVFRCGDKNFGELSPDEKDGLSHRGKALRKLAEELKNLL
ncbi:MAG: XTP/dITP diphosphatase [Clostridia bacterium]|nr:XTP/dITP diphosphatase [Clostridia bacterium]